MKLNLMKSGMSVWMLFLSLGMNAHAQDPVQDSEVSVDLGKYSLVNSVPVTLNGVRYLSVQLTSREWNVDQYRSLPNMKNWIVFGSDMLQTAGSIYGVINVNPRNDKLRHFFAGYAAASFTHGTLELILPNTLKHRRLISALAGAGASIVAGVAKEYWDSLGHGHVEALDAVATAGGGTAGAASVGLGSAVVNSALGGLLSSLTLTIDTDRVIDKIKRKRGRIYSPDYQPF